MSAERTATSSGLRLVLVGATGALGREVLAVLEQASLPIAELVPVATEQSVGVALDFRDSVLSVETQIPSLARTDLMILCTPPQIALELIRASLRAEVACIDCSGALARSEEIPLLVADLCPAAEAMQPVVGTPSGAALAWALTLSALQQAAGLERVVGTVLQPVSHAGRAGIDVLSTETIALLSQSEPPEPELFPDVVAFDCVPSTGPFAEDTEDTEDARGAGGDRATVFESRLRADLRRLLGPDLEVAVTGVQVPTFVGEGSTLAVQTRSPLSVEDAMAALEKAPGVELWASQDASPSTRDSSACAEVLVGRVRRDPSHERGLLLWLAADGLRLVASNVAKLAETRLRLN
jgi:aspartate-semialdehyde dehydrogenase